MANPQTSIAAGLTAHVLQLLGQGELLLVDLDGLFQVAELDEVSTRLLWFLIRPNWSGRLAH